ncbi:Alpha/Beta hydrolase protein [Lipomyces doorenjongii]
MALHVYIGRLRFYVFGIMVTTVAVNAYNLDSYAEGSGEVAAWMNFSRTTGGFIISYFQVKWAAASGTIVSFGVQGAICFAAFGLVMLLHMYGKQLRQRSGRYTSTPQLFTIMTTCRTSSGFVQIPEGKLFWVLDEPLPASEAPRPLLLFIHAGVTDCTLWDGQVSYFTARGWTVLRYDMFGWGRSTPNESFLCQPPESRPKVKPLEHPVQILEALRDEMTGGGIVGAGGTRVVVIGISAGGMLAIDFTLANPHVVVGLVAVAAGLSGDDSTNTEEEDKLFEQCGKLEAARDVEGLALMNDIAAREFSLTGGNSIACEGLKPPAVLRLGDINMPVAVAIGTLDATATIAGMRRLCRNVGGAVAKEFCTAHMVNLEAADEFNSWLEAWLAQYVDQ